MSSKSDSPEGFVIGETVEHLGGYRTSSVEVIHAGDKKVTVRDPDGKTMMFVARRMDGKYVVPGHERSATPEYILPVPQDVAKTSLGATATATLNSLINSVFHRH